MLWRSKIRLGERERERGGVWSEKVLRRACSGWLPEMADLWRRITKPVAIIPTPR